MDPNSANPTSRPPPPGGRRRNHQSLSNKTTPANSSDPTPSHSRDASPPLGNLPEETDSFPEPAMSTSDTQATLQPSPKRHQDVSAGTTNTMSRQEIDDALKGLTRDDLFLALTRAKEEMDRLDSLVSDQNGTIESLTADNSELVARLHSSDTQAHKYQLLVQQREARVDELAYDQEKMENDFFQKLGTLERLKARADETDRKLYDTERKAAELSQAAEKEREYYQNQEALLKSQNTRLTKDNTDLKEEVAHLRDTVESLISQAEEQEAAQQQQTPHVPTDTGAPSDATSSAPRQPTTPSRTPSRRLQPGSNHQSPLTRRTLASETMSEDTAALQAELEQLRKTLASQHDALSEVRNSLNSERTRTAELETEKQELESLLTGNTLEQLVKGKATGRWPGSSTGSRSTTTADSISEEDEEDESSAAEDASSLARADDEDLSGTPKTPKARRSGGRGPRASVVRRKHSSDHLPNALASELGSDGNSKDDSDPSSLPTDVKQLQADLARARHENKNLTMYISKILNRILSMEGFEKVLAQDALDPSGSLRGTYGRSKRKPRHSVLPVPSAPAVTATKDDQRKDRRKSAGLLSFVRSSSPDDLTASPTGAAAAPRPARTASVDWRNIKLPWTSSGATSPSPNENPNLRPFHLSPNIEDDDERERQRARAMLQMEGHAIPEHQLASPRPSARPTAAQTPSSPSVASTGGSFAGVLTRLLGGTTGPSDPAKSPTIMTSDEGRFASPRPSRVTNAAPSAADTSTSSTAADDSMSSTLSSAPLTEFTLPRSGIRRPPRPSPRVSTQGIGIEFPTASTPIDDAADTSLSSRADVSLAGDESYAMNSSSTGVDTSSETESQPQTTWRRALKRMSLLGGEVPPGAAAATASAASTATKPKPAE